MGMEMDEGWDGPCYEGPHSREDSPAHDLTYKDSATVSSTVRFDPGISSALVVAYKTKCLFCKAKALQEAVYTSKPAIRMRCCIDLRCMEAAMALADAAGRAPNIESFARFLPPREEDDDYEQRP